jgi:protein TonB
MLKTLLESKSRRDRRLAGGLVSVTTHTALIAAALYATAEGRVPTPQTRDMVRPVYFPPAWHLAPTASPSTSQPKALNPGRLVFVDAHVNIQVPPINLSGLASKPDDFAPGHLTAGGSNGTAGSGEGSPAGGVLGPDQVEKQAALVPGSARPRYPETLRASGVEGRVTAAFVVDQEGRAEEGTIRFVESGNPLFEDAVRAALRRMRFIPAEVGGRKVRQLVQMPFVFTLER